MKDLNSKEMFSAAGKFQKFVFGTALAGLSIEKRISATHIVAENRTEFCISISVDGQKGKQFDSLFFFGGSEEEAEENYREWIDGIVDDDTAINNKAEAVRLVLDYLEI